MVEPSQKNPPQIPSLNTVKKFIIVHRTKFLAGAVVLLYFKNRGLQKDIDTYKKRIDKTQNKIDKAIRDVESYPVIPAFDVYFGPFDPKKYTLN